jgi:hypothetical protein
MTTETRVGAGSKWLSNVAHGRRWQLMAAGKRRAEAESGRHPGTQGLTPGNAPRKGIWAGSAGRGGHWVGLKLGRKALHVEDIVGCGGKKGRKEMVGRLLAKAGPAKEFRPKRDLENSKV